MSTSSRDDIELRLRGREPSFVVTPPPTEDAFGDTADARPNASTTPVQVARPDLDDGATSRINLRLPDSLKLRVEEAAGREGVSVNAWLVRTAAAALDPDNRDHQPRRRSPRGGEHYTGWVR